MFGGVNWSNGTPLELSATTLTQVLAREDNTQGSHRAWPCKELSITSQRWRREPMQLCRYASNKLRPVGSGLIVTFYLLIRWLKPIINKCSTSPTDFSSKRSENPLSKARLTMARTCRDPTTDLPVSWQHTESRTLGLVRLGGLQPSLRVRLDWKRQSPSNVMACPFTACPFISGNYATM